MSLLIEKRKDVLRENKNIYERMVKMAREVYPNTGNFDLDYVGVLLDEYIKALKKKEYGVNYDGDENYNSHIHGLFYNLYDVFEQGYSKLFLNSFGEISVDKETKMFGYSVVFKFDNAGMTKGARLFDDNKNFVAQNVLDRILEFFVVFLDFYKEVNYKQENTEQLAEEMRPKVNVEGEYGLLYNNNSKEFAVKEGEVGGYIEQKVIYNTPNISTIFEKYKDVKFNGKFK